MFFDLNKLGDWLRTRLGKRAIDLTEDDMQRMSKDQLIMSIKELQMTSQKQDYQLKRKSEQIFNSLMKLI